MDQGFEEDIKVHHIKMKRFLEEEFEWVKLQQKFMK